MKGEKKVDPSNSKERKTENNTTIGRPLKRKDTGEIKKGDASERKGVI